ncbi:hypothetical protein KC357_g12 [Hortaea werneckii]|nr:hypothetical protein KC357_g12 [Hortaea werneckii]
MGQYMGCEYTKLCGCLEYAAVDEGALESKDANGYQAYVHAKQNGYVIDTTGMPKRFPYRKSKVGDEKVPSTLQPFYLEERHPIYECNSNCNCGPVCKSRVVQKGRKVPLVIFKTPNNRGWGVYCAEDLIRGEFIDTYLGEVITNEEADGRESKTGKDKASYLELLRSRRTVYGRRDTVYQSQLRAELSTVHAFFAYQDIPAGTELTFDYMDKDEEEEEDVLRQREEAANDPQNEDKKPCNCGARKCRGYLWDNSVQIYVAVALRYEASQAKRGFQAHLACFIAERGRKGSTIRTSNHPHLALAHQSCTHSLSPRHPPRRPRPAQAPCPHSHTLLHQAHQRSTTEHEPDRTAIYPDPRETPGVSVDDGQVRHNGIVHVLPEEGLAAETVQRDAGSSRGWNRRRGCQDTGGGNTIFDTLSFDYVVYTGKCYWSESWWSRPVNCNCLVPHLPFALCPTTTDRPPASHAPSFPGAPTESSPMASSPSHAKPLASPRMFDYHINLTV